MMATQYVAVDCDGMDIYELSDYINDERCLPQLERVDGVAQRFRHRPGGNSLCRSPSIRTRSMQVNDKLLVKVSDRLAEAKDQLDENTTPRSTKVWPSWTTPRPSWTAAKAELNTQKSNITQQLRDAITQLDDQIPDAGAEDRRPEKPAVDKANRQARGTPEDRSDTSLPEVTLPIDDALFASCKQILAAVGPPI